MSKLEELINKLCPRGVESIRLDEICNISRGKVISKDYILSNPGIYPVYSSQTENNGVLGTINTYMYDGEYLTWTTDGARAGSVFYRNGKFNITNVCGLISIKENCIKIKFLFYFLQLEAPKYVSSGMGNPKLMSNVISCIKVPLLPLEIQDKIIHILDNITELVAELAAELTARKKQFEYYRNQLISVQNNKMYSDKLSEIASIYDGTHQTPKYQEAGIPFISVENIANIYDTDKYISLDEYNLYKVKPQLNDLFMTRIGTVGKCAVVNKSMDLAYYVSLALIRPDIKKIDTRYLKYYIESSLGKKELSKRILHHAVPVKINKEDIGKIMISYPELSIQKKIADLLDNFESICADLDIGLPAEIEARKKQYEFYRDHLLTFVQTGHSILTDRQNLIKLFQYVFGYADVMLEDITTLITGATPTTNNKEYWEGGTVPWMNSGEVNLKNVYDTEFKITKKGYDSTSTTIVPIHTVVIALAGQGKTRGKVAITEIELCTNQSLCSIICNDLVNYKYLYYLLDSKYEDLRAISNGDGTRGGLSLRLLKPYRICLPSLEKQKKIVNVLDKFDQITNDIANGIPAEIEARKKQYEYYRDKLLTFKMKQE